MSYGIGYLDVLQTTVYSMLSLNQNPSASAY